MYVWFIIVQAMNLRLRLLMQFGTQMLWRFYSGHSYSASLQIRTIATFIRTSYSWNSYEWFWMALNASAIISDHLVCSSSVHNANNALILMPLVSCWFVSVLLLSWYLFCLLLLCPHECSVHEHLNAPIHARWASLTLEWNVNNIVDAEHSGYHSFLVARNSKQWFICTEISMIAHWVEHGTVL